MSQIIPKKKDSIKILLLSSYDNKTLRMVKKLSDKIIRKYGSEDYEWSGRITPFIARNVSVFLTKSRSESYCIFSQQYKDKWSLNFFKNAEILERVQCTNAEYEKLLKDVRKLVINRKADFVEMKATPKIIELCKWSDIIFIIKIIPFTKGGELIELTIIVYMHLFQNNNTVNKVVLFKEKKVDLSWMAKEMIELGKIRSYQFKDFEELWKWAKKELKVLIKSEGFQMIPLH